MSVFVRCATEGGLHHASARRRGAHDGGHAHEQHYQSGQERPALSSRENPHGSRVLIREATNPQNKKTFHPPPMFFFFFFYYLGLAVFKAEVIFFFF